MKLLLICLLIIFSLVAAKSIVLTLDAPDTNISGLAWGDGKLWAVDQTTDYVYSIDPSCGTVLSSFYSSHPSSIYPTGLAYSTQHNMVCIGFWDSGTNGYVYKYDPDGTYVGSVDMCGG